MSKAAIEAPALISKMMPFQRLGHYFQSLLSIRRWGSKRLDCLSLSANNGKSMKKRREGLFFVAGILWAVEQKEFSSMKSKIMFFAGVALTAVISLLWPATSGAQTIVRSFNGDQGLSREACNPAVDRCGRQPEANVATNGEEVVQITRQTVNVYDYSGKLLRATPLPKFVTAAGLNPMAPARKGGPSLGPFEPHVVYDEFIGRWIITVTCSNDCFMVSASSDPTGSWGGIYPTCLQNGPCLNFDPALHIGYDKNGVYYCGGHIGDDNPHTVPGVAYDCFAIPSNEVKAIAAGKNPEHLNRVHNMPLDIIPAIDQNPKKAATAPEFFAAKTCGREKPSACQNSTNFPFEWLVETFNWHGPTGTYNAGGEQVIKTDVGSKENKWLYNLPCCGPVAALPQKGSDIVVRSGESHRMVNLVESGSHLYGALGSGPCTHDCGRQGVDTNNVMFYVDLDCSRPAACVVAQTSKITGEDVSPIYGTVGVDNAGNVGIVAMSSTPTTDLSILMWTHKKMDPPNTFHGPITVVAGTEPYTCIPNKNNLVLIGNAVGISTFRDPLDGSKLWTTQQWGGNATPCVWTTRILEYEVGGKSIKSKKTK